MNKEAKKFLNELSLEGQITISIAKPQAIKVLNFLIKEISDSGGDCSYWKGVLESINSTYEMEELLFYLPHNVRGEIDVIMEDLNKQRKDNELIDDIIAFSHLKYGGHLKLRLRSIDWFIKEAKKQGFFLEKEDLQQWPYSMIKLAQSKHVDIFGLIEKGKAIEIEE